MRFLSSCYPVVWRCRDFIPSGELKSERKNDYLSCGKNGEIKQGL